ncbi:hypothetical protein FJZ40_01155 [Candidatus Shapirobacteria bacterium]|nr:hypothetical protein [Candidatus Shapirobacteria bacterium]
MAKRKIPKKLQGVLWSVDVNHLDLEKDKGYIIHQIFSYGRLEEIAWLFKIFPKAEIIKIFTTHPYKDYEASRFNFVKNYLLNLKNQQLDERHYVKNIPRDLR